MNNRLLRRLLYVTIQICAADSSAAISCCRHIEFEVTFSGATLYAMLESCCLRIMYLRWRQIVVELVPAAVCYRLASLLGMSFCWAFARVQPSVL